MDLRQLGYFLAVAEEGHLGRAADRLNLSQPPLTRAIRALEADLGAVLFVRTPHGMALTEAGRLLQDDSRTITALVKQTTDRLRRAGRGEIGRLDIGIFGSGILSIVPRLLARFGEIRPDVTVALHHARTQQNVEALRQRRLHVMFDRGVQPEPGLVVETVVREAVLVAMPEGSHLATLEAVPLALLERVPMIAGSGPVDPVWDLVTETGFVPRVVHRVADVVAALALVAQGLGSTLVPESASVVALPGLAYRRLDAAHLSIALECAYRGLDVSPALAGLLDVVRDV